MSQQPSPTLPGTLLCPRCGKPLSNDQSWCLECGFAARTRVHPPPSWRLPVVATCLALVLLAAGIAIGLVALVDKHETTPPAATVTVPATTPAATTPTTLTTPTVSTTPTVGTTPTATTPKATTPTVPRTTTVPKTTAPSTPGGATAPGGIG